MSMFFGSKDTIGLDIGSSNIKLVQLKERKGGYELEAFEVLPLPPEIIVEGSIIDSLRLVEAIKELTKKAKIRSKNVALGIAGNAFVIIKRITLPEMTDEELSESIRFEAEQYVPFDIDDVNIDFQIIGPKDEPGQMDVIIVAVKKDIINEYINTVRDAGLIPVVVDVNAFALGNMFEINYEIEPDRNIALVNIGANTININVLKAGETVFTRDTSMGSNIHSEALQKDFGVTFENAEKLKRGESVEGVDDYAAQQSIAAASEELVGEISRSLDYFRSTAFHEDINEIIISGGGALIKGLADQLSNHMGIQVRRAEPFKNIHLPGKFDPSVIDEIGCVGAVAVGLAIRRAGDR